MKICLIENQNRGKDAERYDSETRHYSDRTVLTPLCFLSEESAQWFMDRHYSTEAKEQRKIASFITESDIDALGKEYVLAVDTWREQLAELKSENEKLKSEIYARPDIDDLIKRDPVFFFLVNAIRTLTNEQRVVLIKMLSERMDNNLLTQARQEGFDEGLYKCNEAVLTAQVEARKEEGQRIISALIPSNFDIPAFTHTADFVRHLQYIQKRLSELINADQASEQPAKSCGTCEWARTYTDEPKRFRSSCVDCKDYSHWQERQK